MVSGLRQDLKNLTMPSFDSGSMERGLTSLKSKMQSLHIADIADVNINPGLIMTQMNLLKRLISQAGINDILDINVSSASLTKAMARLSNLSADVPVNFDISGLSELRAALASKSSGLTVPVKYEVQGGPHLPAMGDTIPVHFKPDLAALNAEMRTLSRTEATIPVKFNIGAMPKLGPTEGVKSGSTGIDASTLASWAALKNETYKLNAGLGDLRPLLVAAAIGFDRATYYAGKFATTVGRQLNIGLVSAGILMDRAKGNVAAFGSGLARLAGVTASAIGSGGGGGGGTGITGLGRGFRGFGATLAYTLPVLGLTIRSVAAWHIVLDAVIEALISVGIAAVTAAPAVAVLVNIGKDLATHFHAVHTVTESLGQSIPPLTGKFDDLAHAMAPQAIEIFGGAMNVISSRTGVFSNAATRVINLFDDWTAKTVLWANAQGQMGKFIGAGVGYLSQFAAIIGNVVSAIGNLLTKDPGIAHYLLNIVNGAAQVLKAFSNLPGPVVYATLALHGLYVWTSVLAPAIGLLATKLVTFAASLALLAVNPLTWVVVAGLGMAYLATQAGKADTATRHFIDGIDQKITSGTATDAILGIASSMGQLDKKIKETASSQGLSKIRSQMYSFGNIGSSTIADVTKRLANWRSAFADLSGVFSKSGWNNALHAFGKAFHDTFVPGAGAAIIAKNNIKAFDYEIRKLIQQQGTLFRVAGALTTQGYSLAQSFALEDLASVKAGDSFALAKQKVDDLLTGYKDMSVTGGILENSVNAITFASLQQQSSISQLNQGWTTFIQTVTGGQVQFSIFQKEVYGISNALNGVAPAASQGSAAMGGLSSSSLDVSRQFAINVNNANSLINALTLQASASGLGARGTDLLTAATKDAVAEMIPLAGNSKSAQASLIALAQQGGAPANISFKNLSKWVGTASGSMGKASKSGGPAAQLNSIMGTLSLSSSNLTQDVQNLSIALGTKLTEAEAGAIQLARGGTKPFDDFALAVANTGTDSDTTRKKAIILGDEFLKLANNNVPTAKKEFEAFAIGGLHLTRDQADKLWNSVIKNGVPALNGLGSKSDSIRRNNLGPLQGKLKDVTGGVQGLQSMIDKLHGKTVPVGVDAQASGVIDIKGSGWAYGQGNIRFHGAQGGIVPADMGVQGQDSVLVMTKPGEIFIPPEKGPILAPYLKRAGIPGFASGGQVNQFRGIENQLGGLVSFASDQESADATKAVRTGVAEAMRAAKAAVMKAAAAALGGSSSSIVAYAESFLGKIPYVWGGQSISGADCSGFTSLVYKHAGIGTIPRTSEGQGAWVKRGPPTPGGLAFYHSPAGGPDPGHVAIVANSSQVVSQGGGMGPKMMSLHGMPLLWTGTPPGGFGTAGSLGGVGNLSGNASIAAEQRFAASLFPSHGWSQGLLPALIALWNTESGWSPWAVNPNGGAYGIPQALPSVWGHPYPLGAAGPQIVWGENYIKSRWNNPAAAWGNEMAHHWYGQGGAVPGMAAGGTVSGLRSRLASEQDDERAKFFGLEHAFAQGPAKFRTPLVRQELGTLARRQASEEQAYKALLGTGMTTTHLHHLGAEARAEMDTAGDKWLSRMPGGHPGFARDLRKFLGQISATASGSVPTSPGTSHPPSGGGSGAPPAAVAREGEAFLKAWRTRRGGGFGAAWGPIVLNEQIENLHEKQSRDTNLSHAGGLSSKQRAHWSFLAADDKRRMATLNHELKIERSWRDALGSSDSKLSSWIRAAGGDQSLSRNVTGWKTQLGRQKATIGNISKMLGWTNEHLAAFPPQPKITHTYGGDVADTTGAFLQSVLNPFTGVSMDQGGWLKPGWNPPMYNGTGAPERVGGDGCTVIQLSIDDAGNTAFEQFLHMSIRKWVKVKGGGSVQRAYGSR